MAPGRGTMGSLAMPKTPAPTACCKNQSFKADNQRPQEWLCVTGGRHCGVLGLDYTTHCATCACHTTAAGTGGSSASPTWGLISLCPSQDIGQGPQQPLLVLSGDLGQREGTKAPLENNGVPQTCGVLLGQFSSLDQQRMGRGMVKSTFPRQPEEEQWVAETSKEASRSMALHNQPRRLKAVKDCQVLVIPTLRGSGESYC